MLVLSRKLGQSFQIGPEVRITIVKIDRNSVRIGIHAPDEVSVQREEIAFEVPQPQPARSRRGLMAVCVSDRTAGVPDCSHSLNGTDLIRSRLAIQT